MSTPSAWSMAIGSTAPWTDHEKNVCSFVRRAISSLVMEPGAVVMAMGHLGSACRPGHWPQRVSDDAPHRHRVVITAQRRGDGDPAESAQETPADFPEAIEDQDDPEGEQSEQEQLAQVGDRQDQRRDHRQDDGDLEDQLEDVAVEERLD